MLTLLARNWWMLVLRGLLAIAFGLMALIWPGLTVGVLVILFGVYVLIEGLLAISAAVSYREEKSWWILFFEGLVGIAAGLCAFIWPGLTAIVLLVFIALWAILTGILEIAAAVLLRREIPGEWVLGIAGIASILIGILLLANPGAGLLAVVWLIGIYALLFGGLLAYLGIAARRYSSG
jgi:uncharacterized membrane protein HdeD (DUF308 family)